MYGHHCKIMLLLLLLLLLLLSLSLTMAPPNGVEYHVISLQISLLYSVNFSASIFAKWDPYTMKCRVYALDPWMLMDAT